MVTPKSLLATASSAAFLAALAAAPAAAQDAPDILLINSGLPPATGPGGGNIFIDVLGRLADRNDDGDYDDSYELFPIHPFDGFDEGNTNGIFYAVDARVENGAGVFYLTNNSSGAEWLMRGEDTNFDGAVDQSEIQILADIAALFGSTQNTVGVTINPNTDRVWVATDFPGGGLATWDGASASVLLDTATNGPALATDQFGALAEVDSDDFTRLTWTGDGVLSYIDGFGEERTESIFRFVDANGNGQTDDDELTPFLTPHTLNPSWAQSADFAAGLRDVTITNPNDTGVGDGEPPFFVARLNHLATAIEGGEEAFYFASDSSDTGSFATADSGEGLNGLIFRAVDANQDGDVNDLGEVELWYDGSYTGPNLSLTKVVGIDVGPDGALYVGSINPLAVYRFEDVNMDGDAEDAGERTKVFDLSNYGDASGQPGQGFTPEYGLFLAGLAVTDADAFPYAQVNAPLTGTGCTSDTVLTVPEINGFGLLATGTNLFRAELSNAQGAVAAVLFVGFSSTDWLGFPLPLDLTLFGFPGCFLYQDLARSFAAGVGPAGTAAKQIPVPNDSSLQGLEVPMQWAAVGLATPTQADFPALTRAMTVTIE